MTQLETNEYLSIALGPFNHRSSMEMLFARHGQFLKHSLVGLNSFIDYPLHPAVIEVFWAIELFKAMQRLCYQF